MELVKSFVYNMLNWVQMLFYLQGAKNDYIRFHWHVRPMELHQQKLCVVMFLRKKTAKR